MDNFCFNFDEKYGCNERNIDIFWIDLRIFILCGNVGGGRKLFDRVSLLFSWLLAVFTRI